mmetsp:Transcript_77001/g.174116  ORF Transcript_77001/g.174116 Transcript_77001/m.174116 type:complete len:85 (-) Transcript_77001:115-369(-)
MFLFGPEGIAWAEERAAAAGVTLKELGGVVLEEEVNDLIDTKSPATIAQYQDPSLVQLSTDVRIAFNDDAMQLWSDDGAEDDYF